MNNDHDQAAIALAKQIGKLEERCEIMAIINKANTLYDVKENLAKYLEIEKEKERNS